MLKNVPTANINISVKYCYVYECYILYIEKGGLKIVYL